MSFEAADQIPRSQVCATLSEVANRVTPGSEKTTTKNGEIDVVLIDSTRMDFKQESIQLVLLDEVENALADVIAGRTSDGRQVLGGLKRHAARRASEHECSRRLMLGPRP